MLYQILELLNALVSVLILKEKIGQQKYQRVKMKKPVPIDIALEGFSDKDVKRILGFLRDNIVRPGVEASKEKRHVEDRKPETAQVGKPYMKVRDEYTSPLLKTHPSLVTDRATSMRAAYALLRQKKTMVGRKSGEKEGTGNDSGGMAFSQA